MTYSQNPISVKLLESKCQIINTGHCIHVNTLCAIRVNILIVHSIPKKCHDGQLIFFLVPTSSCLRYVMPMNIGSKGKEEGQSLAYCNSWVYVAIYETNNYRLA